MVGVHGTGSSMLHLFLGLKSLVKVSRYHTDGSVFRLHYRVTVMALLAFTFIVTTRCHFHNRFTLEACGRGKISWRVSKILHGSVHEMRDGTAYYARE